MKNLLRQMGKGFPCILLLWCLLPAVPAMATDYYVSGTGNDTNNGLSTTSPFRTLQRAANLTNPGDVVYIMNGVYDQVQSLHSNHRTVLFVSRSGEPGNYITYKNYPGHTPKIVGTSASWNCVLVLANYIKIEGLEIEGPNQSITYEEARVVYDYYQANKPNVDYNYIGTMNTNGLAIGSGKVSYITHHVEIRNCTVHDFQGGGIATEFIDYITIEDNTVYNNAWYGMYASSGISLFHSRDVDNFSGYKNFISRNTTYYNQALIPWADAGGNLSDGNGIIVDDNKNTQVQGIPAYNGKTLVENNVTFNNGGSGIHAYSCSNVDIRNNTAYHNGNVVSYAETFANSSTNCNVVNNIMYARPGGKVNDNYSNNGVVYNYNMYKGTVTTSGPNDIQADPLFISISTDPAIANFRLQTTSPAIDAGTAAFGLASTDKDGYGRVQGAQVDMGAYESGSVPCTTPTAPSNLSGSASSSHQIGISWNDNSSNETGFQIERKTGAAGSWGYIAGTAANISTYQDSPLQASTTYYYRVRAASGTCVSSYSNEIAVTTQNPGPFVQLEAEQANGYYRVKKNTTGAGNFNSGSYIFFNNVDLGNGFSYCILNLAKGTNIGTTNGRYFEIRIGSPTGTVLGTLETKGTGSWSTYAQQQANVAPVTGVHTIYIVGAGGRAVGNLDWIKFTNDPVVVGTSGAPAEISAEIGERFGAFPNPAKDQLTLTYLAERDGIVNVRLFDPMGKSAYDKHHEVEAGTNAIAIDVRKFQPNLYFAEIRERTNRMLLKIIIE